MSFRTILLFLTLLISVSHELYTQGSSPLIFIYDASKSMSEELNGQTKVNLVNEVLTNVVSAIPEDRSLGLLAYGHRKTKDCEDIEWLASPDSMNKDEIVTALRSLSPRGSAPLGSAVANALKVVNEIEGGATVILITAGIETCGGNICEVVKDQGYKGAKFKFHIIGLGIEKMNIDALRCSTIFGKGQYFEAGTTTSLYQAVNQAINATVDQPDRNFSIYAQKNGELIDADVNITGMGDTTESITLRTFRDTAKVYLTPGSYNIDIKPFDDTHVESIVLQNVSIPEEGKVERSVSFGSGKLSVSSTLNDLPWDAEISIIDIQDKSKVASGRTFGKTPVFEMEPGTYHVQLEAMRIKGERSKVLIENVIVGEGDSSHVTHNFTTGKLSIGTSSPQGLIDATIKILVPGKDNSVASGRTYSSPASNPTEFLLTPGEYDIILEALPLSGKDAEVVLSGIEVVANKKIEKVHNFEFGRLSVKVSNSYGPSDALVKVMDKSSETVLASGRTNATESGNPRDFLLTTGQYLIEVSETGKDESSKKTFTVEIISGEEVVREITF